MTRLKVYLSGPISQGDRNVNFFMAASMEAMLMRKGYAPLNPMRSMVMPHAWDADLTHDEWIAADLPWVECADAVLRLPGASKGADMECDHAELHGVPVFFNVETLHHWRKKMSEEKCEAGQTVTNSAGGKQAHVPWNLAIIPAWPLLLLGSCLEFGLRKYGKDNWRKIPIEDHLNHLLVHVHLWLSGDRSEPHLVNAAARIFFALDLAVAEGKQAKTYDHPEAAKPSQERGGCGADTCGYPDCSTSGDCERDGLFSPGALLGELMEQRVWTTEEVADGLGVSEFDLERLLDGELEVTDALAGQLADMFDTSKDLWIMLERAYVHQLDRLAM